MYVLLLCVLQVLREGQSTSDDGVEREKFVEIEDDALREEVILLDVSRFQVYIRELLASEVLHTKPSSNLSPICADDLLSNNVVCMGRHYDRVMRSFPASPFWFDERIFLTENTVAGIDNCAPRVVSSFQTPERNQSHCFSAPSGTNPPFDRFAYIAVLNSHSSQ